MALSICVIDTGDNFSTDFSKVLKDARGDVDVVIYNMNDTSLIQKIQENSFDGIIITGSSKCVMHDTHEQLPVELLDLGIPILGISYGFQWMIVARGGNVTACEDGLMHEYDKYIGIAKPFIIPVRKYKFCHHDFIQQLPATWTNVLQQQDQCWIAVEGVTRHIGVQFQPELVPATARDFFNRWFEWIKKST
jgi:GMP synthase (glutamine-hydrolysing)